ncbi:TPA: hypothetical protein ACPJUG_001833 [Haemophilus influenzae]|uniref:hypothetical protein n=1 Tax=Haemophilus influenzae TaxID=727 RepID=UPI000CFE9CF3|nr:hypothetical protein [Haemophilus influenzae]AWP53379.1 hypothetical protein DLJ98_00340 [Haemophilus influenzae]PRI39525.1 hypothetical protein BVZ56_00986 [Haemophilus influenzae]PRI88861.1 hypothetical protein BV020_01563 [Haemophilus influenzae]PRJ55592.1 hypothetical protein BV097_00642 [Haemophilus influenzae]PRJ56664.1 hypothetical protein BV094_01476 [Haemophilus influenzae]
MGTVFGINVEHSADIIAEMNKFETIKYVEKLILVYSDNKVFYTKDKLEQFIRYSIWDVLGDYNSALEDKIENLEENIEIIKSVLDKINEFVKIVEEDDTGLRTKAKDNYEHLNRVDRNVERL